MSYQVLARKWRPRRFDEVVGQGHVLQALSNALDSGRLHHAFLFTGTRGVGKTTLARILAKSLNCETGVSATPCGECSTCQDIDAGRFVDLIEVDAASRTKVEDTRELLENVQYAPTRGRYKVYLIDEVHMLSNHSFNALLKTLEEPPPHIKFLLATTDPQKLPVTILSRCLQFNLRRLHPEMIIEYLQKILGNEAIEYQATALKHLARAADGSMRDALSLLDQAIAFGSGRIVEDDVKAMLGTIEQTYIHRILAALSEHDVEALQAALSNLHERVPDYDDVLAEMQSVLHHIALLQQIPGAFDAAMGDQAVLESLAARIPAEDIQLFYQIALLSRRDLPYAPDPVLGFEMAMLRMLSFAPASGDQLSATTPAVGGKQTEQVSAPAATDGDLTKPTVTQSASVGDSVTGDWSDIVEQLGLQGVVKQLAMNCALIARQDDTYELALEPSYENLLTKERHQRLQESLAGYTGKSVKLEIQVRQAEIETPAARLQREEQERLEAAKQSLEADANVKKIVDTFDASIQYDSIQPTK